MNHMSTNTRRSFIQKALASIAALFGFKATSTQEDPKTYWSALSDGKTKRIRFAVELTQSESGKCSAIVKYWDEAGNPLSKYIDVSNGPLLMSGDPAAKNRWTLAREVGTAIEKAQAETFGLDLHPEQPIKYLALKKREEYLLSSRGYFDELKRQWIKEMQDAGRMDEAEIQRSAEHLFSPTLENLREISHPFWAKMGEPDAIKYGQKDCRLASLFKI